MNAANSMNPSQLQCHVLIVDDSPILRAAIKKVVKLAGQSSRRASDEAMPGGPMIEEIGFDLVGKGETIIVFELKRPWEKDVSAVDTRSVKVTVK